MTIQEKLELLAQLGVPIGAPIGGEGVFFDGGTFQQCENGAIYLRPNSDQPIEVHGAIYQQYVDMGEVLSQLLYPISDEHDDPNVPGSRRSLFQNGALFFSDAGEVTQTFNDRESVPQVKLKLVDSVPVNLGQGESLSLSGLADSIARAGFADGSLIVAGIENLIPGLEVRRAFDSLSPQAISDLLGAVRTRSPLYTPPNFENCLEIDFPNGVDLNFVVEALMSWTGVVEYAYVQPEPSEPTIVGTFNPLFEQQGYLSGNGEGIAAMAAWDKGADGSGTNFIDIERGWLFTHHDLPQNITLVDGFIRFESIPHGTATLGEMVAKDNFEGVAGIAPFAQGTALSYYIPHGAGGSFRSEHKLESMILKAIQLLQLGDVLLIEAQFEGVIGETKTVVPVEVTRFVWEAIKAATEKGIVVVEPAGNGSGNLNQLRHRNFGLMLDRNSADFQDSGAILVGAGVSETPHGLDRHSSSFSNFGNRVDCYAWDTHVVTTGSVARPMNKDGYLTGPFATGTSASSAIIAGVCLLVQDLQFRLQPLHDSHRKLDALEMRRMLGNAANGTSSPDPIGIMPDFEKIIENEYEPNN